MKTLFATCFLLALLPACGVRCVGYSCDDDQDCIDQIDEHSVCDIQGGYCVSDGTETSG